jgi:hypothetical protein
MAPKRNSYWSSRRVGHGLNVILILILLGQWNVSHLEAESAGFRNSTKFDRLVDKSTENQEENRNPRWCSQTIS